MHTFSAQEQSSPTNVASVIIVVIMVIAVTTATTMGIVLWRRRYARKLRISTGQDLGNFNRSIPKIISQFNISDNVMYTPTTTIVTIGSNNVAISTTYEPVRDDESTHTPREAQAACEIPEKSGAQSIHTQQVRIMKLHKHSQLHVQTLQ